jgi:hypothetical protein
MTGGAENRIPGFASLNPGYGHSSQHDGEIFGC